VENDVSMCDVCVYKNFSNWLLLRACSIIFIDRKMFKLGRREYKYGNLPDSVAMFCLSQQTISEFPTIKINITLMESFGSKCL
jgi:hypothetical protein